MAEHELNKIVDDEGEVFNLRDSTKQPVADRVTSWGSTPSDTKYPSEKLVKTSLDGKANVADAELSTTSTNPLQNKEITRWHNIIIGDDGFVSGSAAYPQLSLQKLKLGALSHYNRGVNIKIYTYDEGDEENASLVFDIANASDSVKDNFYNGFSMDTLFQSEAGKYVKIVYTGSISCYFRALGVFMDTKDTSSTVSYFYGHLRVSNVDYPESGQFSTWGSLVVAAFSKTSATVAELILRPKTSASKCRIFGFRCLNTYTGSDWAVLIGRATSALKLTNSRKLCVDLSRTADSTFDGSADQTNIPVKNTLPVARGGTGATTAIGAEYNILNQVADIDTTINGDRKIALCNQTKSASNGVFRWIKLSNVWTWIKSKLTGSDVNIGGNAATATTATTAAGYTSGGAIDTALDGKQDDLGISASGDAGKFLNEKGEWATPAGSGVTGVKGDAETNYRTGNVNISSENLGMGTYYDLKSINAILFSIGDTTNHGSIKFFASVASYVIEFTVTVVVNSSKYFTETPAVTMYACRSSGQTLGSSNFVPTVKYLDGDSSTPAKLWVYFGSGNVKRIRWLAISQNYKKITSSEVAMTSIDSSANTVAATSYNYLPIVTGGFNKAVGSSSQPVYVAANGEIKECKNLVQAVTSIDTSNMDPDVLYVM